MKIFKRHFSFLGLLAVPVGRCRNGMESLPKVLVWVESQALSKINAIGKATEKFVIQNVRLALE
jgi:hypothetical protein